MPAAKQVARRTKAKMSVKDIRTYFSTWLSTKAQAEAAAKRQGELRDVLKAEIERQGDPDDKGSLYLDLGEGVEGPDGKVYGSLKNERRVSQTLNEDKAEKLLTAKKLIADGTRLVLSVTNQTKAIEMLTKAGLLGGDDGFSVERMLDEEAILRLHFEGKLTQEEIDSIFDSKETFAFKPLEA